MVLKRHRKKKAFSPPVAAYSLHLDFVLNTEEYSLKLLVHMYNGLLAIQNIQYTPRRTEGIQHDGACPVKSFKKLLLLS